MTRPAALLVLALGMLAGCGPGEREIALCRAVADAVVGPAAAPRSVETRGDAIRIELLGGRAVSCRFAGSELEPGELVAVTIDGRALSDVRLALLLRSLHLPPPPRLLAGPPPPAAPAPGLAYFLQQLVNGLALGAVLGLVAVGYSLIYGITGTIQFAYGEIFMIGAMFFIGLFYLLGLLGIAGLPLLLALAFVLVAGVTSVYGWATERTIYRGLRGSGTQAALIAAIGLSIALRELVRLTQGSRNLWLDTLIPGSTVLYDADGFAVLVGHIQILIILVTVGLGGALAWFLARTASGRTLRACADDPLMAALLGVDVDRAVATAFVIGAALAAVAGGLIAIRYGEADFFMGLLVGFKALTAALLGGFGSVAGALLGAFLIGLFEAFWAGYLGGLWKDTAVFGILVLVLVFRPQGLLGAPAHMPRGR